MVLFSIHFLVICIIFDEGLVKGVVELVGEHECGDIFIM